MVTCFICKDDTLGCIKALFNHFKQIHGLYKQHSQYICCESQCSLIFDDKYTFARHITTQHPDSCLNSDLSVTPLLHNVAAATCHTHKTDDYVVTENTDKENDTDNDSDTPIVKKPTLLKDIAAKSLAECKSGSSSLRQANLMAKCCSDVVAFVVSDISTDLESLGHICDNPQQLTAVAALRAKLISYQRPYEGLENEYSFRSYLEGCGYYIGPTNYIIGSRTTSRLQADTGFSKTTLEECTGQFISISKMILALNANTDLITQALSVDGQHDSDGHLSSFFDGAYWKRHALHNERTLVIRLYGDDFEPCNPLGARKTLYKIGAIYYQFEGLAAVLQSKVENIFLALCYHTDDVRMFGWASVLKPLLCELKALEGQGLILTTKEGLLPVKVVISCITGDNLFLNGILGFVESFSANFPCRHCILPKVSFTNTFVEESSLIRTVASYDADAVKCDIKHSGIKLSSPLNELKYFHAAENFVQDIMHDVLEGVCQYDMTLIINYLLSLKGFSLARMNGLLEHFSYGKPDVCNKPPRLTEIALRSDMLPMTASQTWCLVRVFSLAIGSLVAEGDEVWLLYLQLRVILDILFAPSIELSELTLLKVLIAEYLEQHTLLFPVNTLKKKHHHLIHYPRLIHEVGPLHRYWCMRFEAKHQRSKRVMHMSSNFKNVPYTVASRHQYDVAHRMLANSEFTSQVTVGPGSVVLLSNLPFGAEISICMNNIGVNFELYQCKYVNISGTTYSCGAYVVTDIVDEKPQFVKVLYIFSRDHGRYLWFVGNKLDTLHFNFHTHAWRVHVPLCHRFVSVDPRCLKHVLPLSLHCLSTGKYISGLRHRL